MLFLLSVFTVLPMLFMQFAQLMLPMFLMQLLRMLLALLITQTKMNTRPRNLRGRVLLSRTGFCPE